MPSESESLARELRDDLTPEQHEEQVENLMMCQAEEEDAYIEDIEMAEPKALDEEERFWERLHESGMIIYHLDENSLEEIRLRRLITEAGISIPHGMLCSPLRYSPVIV